jgi:hypothetical protein
MFPRLISGRDLVRVALLSAAVAVAGILGLLWVVWDVGPEEGTSGKRKAGMAAGLLGKWGEVSLGDWKVAWTAFFVTCRTRLLTPY